jgi:heptosyltransferase-1
MMGHHLHIRVMLQKGLTSPVPKTLVLCPIGLGCFIMAIPSLRFLNEELGKQNLHILTLKPGIQHMAKETHFFHRVYFWDPDNQSIFQGLRILRETRREKFDVLISLFPTPHWKYSLFAFLTRAKVRVGFAYPGTLLPRLLHHLSISLDVNAHDVDQNIRLVETTLGKTLRRPFTLSFPLPIRYGREEGLKNSAYFVCHPGCSVERRMKEKRLPPTSFAELIRKIHEEFGLQCVLIGGQEEKPLRDEIQRHVPEALLDYQSKDLSETGALIAHSQFFLGNDSGPMHISVALGKRCIVFLGPTDERRSGPYRYWCIENGQPTHLIVRREDLDCAPCWTIHTIAKRPACIFGDTRCLRALEIEKVWPKMKKFIRQLLEETRHA